MKRPAGVTIIALVLVLNAAILIARLAIAAFRPVTLQSIANLYFQRLFPDIHTPDVAFWICWSLFVICGSIVVGFGLWNLKKWSRWALLFAVGIPLGRGLISVCSTLLVDTSNFGKMYGGTAGGLFWSGIMIEALIVGYLVQPEIIQAFHDEDY
ncbi:MAG TPA: hypothetical protein VH593_11115 [Ktedonobacteraceae bacterium]|jgi:tryptophan-rich sensory protein